MRWLYQLGVINSCQIANKDWHPSGVYVYSVCVCMIRGWFSEKSDRIIHCCCEKIILEIILVVSNPPLLKFFTANVCVSICVCLTSSWQLGYRWNIHHVLHPSWWLLSFCKESRDRANEHTHHWRMMNPCMKCKHTLTHTRCCWHSCLARVCSFYQDRNTKQKNNVVSHRHPLHTHTCIHCNTHVHIYVHMHIPTKLVAIDSWSSCCWHRCQWFTTKKTTEV